MTGFFRGAARGAFALLLVLAVSGCTGVPVAPLQTSATAVASPLSTNAPGLVAPATPVATVVMEPAASAAPVATEVTEQATSAASVAPEPAASATPIPDASVSAMPDMATESPPAIQATPVEQSGDNDGVLYHDDFTDAGSGWPDNVEYDNYYIGYHEPDHYHVEVHVPHDRALAAVPGQTFTDFTMESKTVTEPNNTAQTGDFRYGLFFRRSGSQYYAFVISPHTKSWSVLKSSPTGLVTLKEGVDDSIQGLTTEDTLRVDAKGSTFFFHINDHVLGQVADADYATGSAGFLVETLDSPRTHIHFGATTIREVETPPLACTILVNALYVRSGPGLGYPPIAIVRLNAQVEPLGRDAAGSWINVRIADGNITGWISSAPAYVSCSAAITDLVIRQP